MQTITLPRRVVEQVLKASVAFEALHDELEEYLTATDQRVLKKLRQARREHMAGKTRPFIFPR